MVNCPHFVVSLLKVHSLVPQQTEESHTFYGTIVYCMRRAARNCGQFTIGSQPQCFVIMMAMRRQRNYIELYKLENEQIVAHTHLCGCLPGFINSSRINFRFALALRRLSNTALQVGSLLVRCAKRSIPRISNNRKKFICSIARSCLQ